MASDSTSLLTTEEASGLIGLVFRPDEPRRSRGRRWTNRARLRCLIRATSDRIVWKGRDVATTQRHRWPRKAIQHPHAIVTDRAGEDTSSDFTPNMPIAIRRALVAQARRTRGRRASTTTSIHKSARSVSHHREPAG